MKKPNKVEKSSKEITVNIPEALDKNYIKELLKQGLPKLSVIKSDNKKIKKYNKFKRNYGFCISELWNMDITLAKFMLNRVILYKKCTMTKLTEGSDTESDVIYNKIIVYLDMVAYHLFDDLYSAYEQKKITEEYKPLFDEYWAKMGW